MKILTSFFIVGALVYLVARRTLRTIRELGLKRHPEFFYRNVEAKRLGIPVFTYHSVGSRDVPNSVTLAEFENHMKYLSYNGYQTLDADELYAHVVHGSSVPPKAVVLTFDDGRATLWSIVYPILKKYNLRAVSFIVPSMISEAGVRPTIYNNDAGRCVSPTELFGVDLSKMPTVTWDEVRVMYESGLVDFQSHTFDHTLIYCSQEIGDFINPEFNFWLL